MAEKRPANRSEFVSAGVCEEKIDFELAAKPKNEKLDHEELRDFFFWKTLQRFQPVPVVQG